MEKHAETIIPPLWCQICILKLNEISIYNIWGWGYKRGVACFVLLLVTKLDVAVVREYRVKEFEVKRGRKGMVPGTERW